MRHMGHGPGSGCASLHPSGRRARRSRRSIGEIVGLLAVMPSLRLRYFADAHHTQQGVGNTLITVGANLAILF